MPNEFDSNNIPVDDDEAREEDERTPQEDAATSTTDEPVVDDAELAFEELDTEASLRAQVEAAQQRSLRLQAELENFRKRRHRTMEEERRYAGLPLMRDVLAVMDNLQRAIEAAEQAEHKENAAGLLAGVKMVADQLTTVLKQHHCEPIEADGQVFDPNKHEAIAQQPSDQHEPGHVSLVTQVGYQLHDRVVRPAQVIVAAPRAEDA